MNEPANNKHAMKNSLRCVGLDVHAQNITIALRKKGGVRPGRVSLFVEIIGDALIVASSVLAVSLIAIVAARPAGVTARIWSGDIR